MAKEHDTDAAAFDPFGGDRRAIAITEADERLLAIPAAPLRILIPVEIEEAPADPPPADDATDAP